MARYVYIVGTLWKVWSVEIDAIAWALEHGFTRDDVMRVDTCAVHSVGVAEYAGAL